MLQNGVATAGYTVTAPGYAGGPASNAAMHLDECQRGVLLNAASATSDVTSDALYGSEVVLPAAAAGATSTVTPAASAGEDIQRHAVQVYRQVCSPALRIKYF